MSITTSSQLRFLTVHFESIFEFIYICVTQLKPSEVIHVPGPTVFVRIWHASFGLPHSCEYHSRSWAFYVYISQKGHSTGLSISITTLTPYRLIFVSAERSRQMLFNSSFFVVNFPY